MNLIDCFRGVNEGSGIALSWEIFLRSSFTNQDWIPSSFTHFDVEISRKGLLFQLLVSRRCFQHFSKAFLILTFSLEAHKSVRRLRLRVAKAEQDSFSSSWKKVEENILCLTFSHYLNSPSFAQGSPHVKSFLWPFSIKSHWICWMLLPATPSIEALCKRVNSATTNRFNLRQLTIYYRQSQIPGPSGDLLSQVSHALMFTKEILLSSPSSSSCSVSTLRWKHLRGKRWIEFPIQTQFRQIPLWASFLLFCVSLNKSVSKEIVPPN